MRRIVFAAMLFLAASPALAANRYVDNRQAATGTAQSSGSTTTVLKINVVSTYDANVAPAYSDFVNMGLTITAGTSAPSATTPFKITSVDLSEPAKPALTVHTSFGATPANDWTFIISYGCNANTTFTTQTKGGSLTGPKLTLYQTYNNSSSGDVIYVRGGGPAYNGAYDSGSAPLIFNGNGRNITVEGFYSTPGDLYLPAGERATLTNMANAPYINVSGSSVTLNAGSGLSSATSITLRNLKINNAATGGYALKNDGSSASWTVTECVLGTSDMPANGTVFADTTTSGVTKNFIFTECTWFTENVWIVAGCAGHLSVTDCNMDAVIASTSNHAIQLTSSDTSASNHLQRVTFDDIDMTFSGASSTATLIRATGLAYCNQLKVSRVTAAYNSAANWLDISDGIANLLVENCSVTCSTTPTAQTMLAIGSDTTPNMFNCGYTPTVIHSAAASAAGTGNISAGGNTFVLSSTGSPSSTNDFYVDRFIRFPAQITQRTRRITAYNGGTRTITIYGTFDANSTAPAYEIVKYNRVSSSLIVRNNTLKFTGDRSHVILCGQGADGVLVENNTCLNGDYSIVIKSEDCRIIGNRVTGETPMILKGASRNIVSHNTFYSVAAGPSAAVFEFSDKSPTVENLHLNEQFGKCAGNVITNNIIACKSTVGNRLMFEFDIGDGSWAEDTDDGPLRQNNYIDYNGYAMGNGANFGYVDSANVASFTAWKAKMANVEADGWPYCKMYPLNDANSFAGSIVFRDPENGDFTVIGGTLMNMVGSNGLPIGAARTIRRTSPFIFSP